MAQLNSNISGLSLSSSNVIMYAAAGAVLGPAAFPSYSVGCLTLSFVVQNILQVVGSQFISNEVTHPTFSFYFFRPLEETSYLDFFWNCVEVSQIVLLAVSAAGFAVTFLPVSSSVAALALSTQVIALSILAAEMLCISCAGSSTALVTMILLIIEEVSESFLSFSISAEIPDWPFIGTMKHESTEKGLSIPPEAIDILDPSIPAPRISWEHLSQTKEGQDLYDRIRYRRTIVNASPDTFYPRLEKYVGYLLTYAEDNPMDRGVMYNLFAETTHRCEGIFQDIENAYYLYCAKSNKTTLTAFLTNLGWKIRQGLFANTIQNWERHDAAALRNTVAARIGIPPSQENDPAELYWPEQAGTCIQYVLSRYPIHLVQTLYEDIKKPPADVSVPFRRGPKATDHRFRLEDDAETLVSYSLFEEMAKRKCLSEEIVFACEAALSAMIDRAKTAEGLREVNAQLFLHEDSFDFPSIEDILNPEHIFPNAIQRSLGLSIRQSIFYPIFLGHMREKDLLAFLVDQSILELSVSS